MDKTAQEIRDAFQSLHDALAAKSNSERDVSLEIGQAVAVIAERVVLDLHDIAEYARDENKRRSG